MPRQIETNAPQALAAELAAVRQASRELHETIQHAKQTRRELLRAVEAISPTVDEMIEKEVAEGLARYQEALEDAITRSTQAVYARFDRIVDILLGEYGKGRRHNRSIVELLEGRTVTLTSKQRQELQALLDSQGGPSARDNGTDRAQGDG
jgi:hypothetical protein